MLYNTHRQKQRSHLFSSFSPLYSSDIFVIAEHKGGRWQSPYVVFHFKVKLSCGRIYNFQESKKIFYLYTYYSMCRIRFTREYFCITVLGNSTNSGSQSHTRSPWSVMSPNLLTCDEKPLHYNIGHGVGGVIPVRTQGSLSRWNL